LRRINKGPIYKGFYRRLAEGVNDNGDSFESGTACKEAILDPSDTSRAVTSYSGDALDQYSSLTGRFLQIRSSRPLATFSPTTIAAKTQEGLSTSTLKKIKSGELDFEIDHDTLNFVINEVRDQYVKILSAALVSGCTDQPLEIDGHQIYLDQEVDNVLTDFFNSLKSNPNAASIFIPQALNSLIELSKSLDINKRLNALIRLSLFKHHVLNFFNNFSKVLEASWDPYDLFSRSSFNGLGPEAVLGKVFYEMEISFFQFFISARQNQLRELTTEEQFWIFDDILTPLFNFQQVDLPPDFLFERSKFFIFIAGPCILHRAITPKSNSGIFDGVISTSFIHFKSDTLNKLASGSHIDPKTVLTPLSPEPTKKKKKRKKKESKSTKKSRFTGREVQQTGAKKVAKILARTPQLIEFINQQQLFLNAEQENQFLLNLKSKLDRLFELVTQSLNSQEDIASPEVLEWFQATFDRLQRLEPEFLTVMELTENYTSKLDNFDLHNLTLEMLSQSQQVVNLKKDQNSSLRFQINALQSKLKKAFITMEAVINRKFKDYSSQTITIEDDLEDDIDDLTDSEILKDIRSPLNGDNPRFESILEAERFLGFLKLEIEPGGKHFKICRGRQRITTIAISTIRKKRLYIWKVVKQLYLYHNISSDSLKSALEQYL